MLQLLKQNRTTVSRTNLYLHSAYEFSTRTLAYMLDSLVRVSRRVNENHFVRIVDVIMGIERNVRVNLKQNFVFQQATRNSRPST